MRTKRDQVVDLIKDYSVEKNISVVEQFNVGSYKIKTGVKRQGDNGWAFDIDYVLVFDNEFDYETYKNNLTNWLRNKVKEKYDNNVKVYNKKKVLSVAFRDNENNKTEFYLDIAFYVRKEDDQISHIKRNDNGNYLLEEGKPKDTYKRQRQSLAEEHNKRNRILLLKYLREKNRILGASSIFITDSVINCDDELDTYSLMKSFVENNINTDSFTLQEMPYSELINDSGALNDSLKEMNDKFYSKNTTVEVYNSMNQWFDNSLPDLEKEELEERRDRYSGG